MATKTDTARRADRDLGALLAGVGDLLDVAKEWEELSDEERAEESLYWDHYMADFLPELDEYYRAGHLSEEQHERYEELRSKLKEALPVIEKLNFYQPPAPLDG